MLITRQIYRTWPRLWWIVVGDGVNMAQGYAWTVKGAKAKANAAAAEWDDD